MKKNKSFKDMSKQERLDATASSIRDSLSPSDKEYKKDSYPFMEDSGINVGPIRPDPERKANESIERAANGGRSAEIMKIMEARKNMPINPETGMPFYSDPSAVSEEQMTAPVQPAASEEEERRQIRMQLLQEASKTGVMPQYLKKY